MVSNSLSNGGETMYSERGWLFRFSTHLDRVLYVQQADSSS